MKLLAITRSSLTFSTVRGAFGSTIVAVLLPGILVSGAAQAADESVSGFQLTYEPGVPIEVATRAQKEVAVKQYRMGIDLLGAGKAEEALELFRMSYEKVASPNSRLMMARALVRLEHFVQARRELLAVIEEAERLALGADKYGNTADAARKELELVNQRVAIIQLERDGVLEVNGSPVVNEAVSELVVMPGSHEVLFRLNNGQQARQTIEAEAGQHYQLNLEVALPQAPAPVSAPPPDLAPTAPADHGISRMTLGIASASVAALGAAGFVTFGLLDRSQYQQLERDCSDKRCPQGLQNEIEIGRTYQTLANAGLGVGVVGLVGAAYFFLTARSDGSPSEEGPQVGVGPNQVQVFGRF